MDRIESINAHYTWFQVQMCLLGVSIIFRGTKTEILPILQKIQIPISSKLCIGLAQNLTG